MIFIIWALFSGNISRGVWVKEVWRKRERKKQTYCTSTYCDNWFIKSRRKRKKNENLFERINARIVFWLTLTFAYWYFLVLFVVKHVVTSFWFVVLLTSAILIFVLLILYSEYVLLYWNMIHISRQSSQSACIYFALLLMRDINQ